MVEAADVAELRTAEIEAAAGRELVPAAEQIGSLQRERTKLPLDGMVEVQLRLERKLACLTASKAAAELLERWAFFGPLVVEDRAFRPGRRRRSASLRRCRTRRRRCRKPVAEVEAEDAGRAA